MLALQIHFNLLRLVVVGKKIFRVTRPEACIPALLSRCFSQLLAIRRFLRRSDPAVGNLDIADISEQRFASAMVARCVPCAATLG